MGYRPVEADFSASRKEPGQRRIPRRVTFFWRGYSRVIPRLHQGCTKRRPRWVCGVGTKATFLGFALLKETGEKPRAFGFGPHRVLDRVSAVKKFGNKIYWS